jgi:hypothetical protein
MSAVLRVVHSALRQMNENISSTRRVAAFPARYVPRARSLAARERSNKIALPDKTVVSRWLPEPAAHHTAAAASFGSQRRTSHLTRVVRSFERLPQSLTSDSNAR